MSLKNFYRGLLVSLERRPEKLEKLKVNCAETISIWRKHHIWKEVSWTEVQQKEFDLFWIENYGKKIPNYWHRLYQAVSGTFSVDYIPEKLFTSRIEFLFNDYKYAKVLEDKSLVEILATGCGCKVPETVIVCSGRRYSDAKREPISKEEAVSILKSTEDVVLKPTVGSSSGHGVRFISTLREKQEQEISALLDSMGSDFIAQKKIKGHPEYAVFNPTSINTIRITTYILNGEIHHMPIAFRIGRKGKQVDNIHAGGIGVGVNDDGSLLPVAYELGYGDSGKKHLKHPDTGVVFDGWKLPCISEIIQVAYSVHSRMPHIGFVSWDFTVDESNIVILIEANIKGQGVWFPQMIHGKGLFGENTGDILRLLKG